MRTPGGRITAAPFLWGLALDCLAQSMQRYLESLPKVSKRNVSPNHIKNQPKGRKIEPKREPKGSKIGLRAVLGGPWGFWGDLGRSWGGLGRLLAALGAVLGRLLGAPGLLLGRSWDDRGGSWRLLGRSWGVVGHILNRYRFSSDVRCQNR